MRLLVAAMTNEQQNASIFTLTRHCETKKQRLRIQQRQANTAKAKEQKQIVCFESPKSKEIRRRENDKQEQDEEEALVDVIRNIKKKQKNCNRCHWWLEGSHSNPKQQQSLLLRIIQQPIQPSSIGTKTSTGHGRNHSRTNDRLAATVYRHSSG